jgi:hypothetical protein
MEAASVDHQKPSVPATMALTPGAKVQFAPSMKLDPTSREGLEWEAVESSPSHVPVRHGVAHVPNVGVHFSGAVRRGFRCR